MYVTKFVIDGNDVFVKDAQARDSITTLSDDVTTAQSTADRAEGKADDAQTVADRAEGKADTAQSTADGNTAAIADKQANLNHAGTFTGNIDDLKGDDAYNGGYFVQASGASGTQPGDSYYALFVCRYVQFAYTQNTSTRYFYIRSYESGSWTNWRKVQLT